MEKEFDDEEEEKFQAQRGKIYYVEKREMKISTKLCLRECIYAWYGCTNVHFNTNSRAIHKNHPPPVTTNPLLHWTTGKFFNWIKNLHFHVFFSIDDNGMTLTMSRAGEHWVRTWYCCLHFLHQRTHKNVVYMNAIKGVYVDQRLRFCCCCFYSLSYFPKLPIFLSFQFSDLPSSDFILFKNNTRTKNHPPHLIFLFGSFLKSWRSIF